MTRLYRQCAQLLMAGSWHRRHGGDVAMTVLLDLCRYGLAVVFATAAVGKVQSFADTASATVQLGIPAWLARPLGRALPLIEGTVAVGLVFASTTVLAAELGFALVTVGTAVIAGNLAVDVDLGAAASARSTAAPSAPARWLATPRCSRRSRRLWRRGAGTLPSASSPSPARWWRSSQPDGG